MEVKGVLLCLWLVFLGLITVTLESFPNSTNSTLRTRRQSSFTCTLPPQLENGRWLVTEADVKPGDQVTINTIIRVECHESYQLFPNIPLHLCDSNWDETTFPTCQKKCPPFYSTATTTVTCKDLHNGAVPCDRAIDGTYLTYTCKVYYEIPPGGRNILYCDDGVWDFPKPICQPICGKKVNRETTALAWGGREVKNFEFPWVIALFETLGTSYENKCGGTLISRRVVVTAAHCVTDTYGNALDKNKFQVAAGKLYNAFGDKRDVDAQYRKISKVIVHDGYRGESQRYIADLAILITQELFKLDIIVQPACIENVNNIYLTNYQIGEVAGWGRTEEEKPSEILKAIRVPYKDGATCAKELPQSWEEQFNYFDKICAGRQNESTAVCKGDSGSGLVFKNREDNRYYLQGIVSIAPNLNTFQCNYQTNALYTSVPFYYSFIKREMTKNHLEDCILPAYPKNGKWFLEDGVEKRPGDVVLSSTILRFSCNVRFILSTVSPYYDCESYYNHPTCLRLCPKPSLPTGTQILCKNSKDQFIDCTVIADGSSITFTCPNGFVSDRGTPTSTRYCRNGVYGNSAPSCTDVKQNPVYISTILYKSKTKIQQTPTTATSSRIATPKSVITSRFQIPEPIPSQIDNDGKKLICDYTRGMAYNGSYTEDVEPGLCSHLIYDMIDVSENGELDLKKKGSNIHCSNKCDFKCLKVLMVSSFLTIFFSLTTWGIIRISNNYYYKGFYNESNESKNDSSVGNNSSSFDNLYVSRIYWLAQSPATQLDRLDTPVPLIIIHHTATESCLSSAECKLQTRLIQSFHIENRYWSDIAYNFLIGGDGKIYEGRGWISEGAHTYNYNKKSLGIAFIGTFTNSVPRKEQINALGVLIEKGVQLGYVATDYKIFGARQLSPTESPGKSFYELIKTWSHWSEKVV